MEKAQELVTVELHIDYEMQKSTVISDDNDVVGMNREKMSAADLVLFLEKLGYHRELLEEIEPCVSVRKVIRIGRSVVCE